MWCSGVVPVVAAAFFDVVSDELGALVDASAEVLAEAADELVSMLAMYHRVCMRLKMSVMEFSNACDGLNNALSLFCGRCPLAARVRCRYAVSASATIRS